MTTRLSSDVTKPSATSAGDGPADSTDVRDIATSVKPNFAAAAAAGYATVNAVQRLGIHEPPSPPTSQGRFETYIAMGPTGPVKIRRDLDTNVCTKLHIPTSPTVGLDFKVEYEDDGRLRISMDDLSWLDDPSIPAGISALFFDGENDSDYYSKERLWTGTPQQWEDAGFSAGELDVDYYGYAFTRISLNIWYGNNHKATLLAKGVDNSLLPTPPPYAYGYVDWPAGVWLDPTHFKVHFIDLDIGTAQVAVSNSSTGDEWVTNGPFVSGDTTDVILTLPEGFSGGSMQCWVRGGGVDHHVLWNGSVPVYSGDGGGDGDTGGGNTPPEETSADGTFNGAKTLLIDFGPEN